LKKQSVQRFSNYPQNQKYKTRSLSFLLIWICKITKTFEIASTQKKTKKKKKKKAQKRKKEGRKRKRVIKLKRDVPPNWPLNL